MYREKLEFKKYYFCLYVLLFFFIWLAAQIPYTHDDWDWGIDLGMQQFLYATVNSRYSGNLLEVILTRSEFAKNAVMGFTFFALPLAAVLLIPRTDNFKNSDTFILVTVSYMLFLSIGKNMWCETNGWIAGFSNYTFSVLVLSAFLKQVQHVATQSTVGQYPSIPRALIVFITVLALQMFLENLTLFVLLFCCLLLVFSLRHNRCIAFSASALLASIIGAVLMFSSSIYSTLLSSGQAVDGYRQLTFRAGSGILYFVLSITRNIATRIIPPLYIGCYLHCIILLAALLALACVHTTLYKNFYILLDIVCISVFAAEFFGMSKLLDSLNHRIAVALIALFSVFFFAVVFMQLQHLLKPYKSLQIWALIFWLAPPIIVFPMAAVNTIGVRTFYTSLFFISLVILAVSSALLSECTTKLRCSLLAGSVVVILALIIHFSIVYNAIGQIKRQRDEIISVSVENEASVIVLPNFPYESYLHGANPVGEEKMVYFKDFYGIPQKSTVIFLD